MQSIFGRAVQLALLLFVFSTVHAQSPVPAENRLAIQSMIDALGTLGGTVSITAPGVYNLDVVNCEPFNSVDKCALTINTSNIKFSLGPGVTVRLADNQKTNGVYLSIIALGSNLSNVTIEGEGRITGNTAGQSAYSEGYSQGSNFANLIRPYGKLTNFTLRGLHLDDIYSCPIDIPNLGVGSGNWHRNITFENLTTNNVGEGIQCQTCQNVKARNITAMDDNLVNQGDAFELGACENFTIDGIYAENQGSIDIFGSKYGTLSHFISKNCSLGVDLDSYGNVPNTTDVVVSDGLIIMGVKNSVGIRLYSDSSLEARSLRGISLSNITIRGQNGTESLGLSIGAPGFPNPGPFSITNVNVSSVDYCATTFIVNNIKVNGFGCFDSPNQIVLHPHGVVTGGHTPADSVNYHFSNITGDIRLSNVGLSGSELTGTFENIRGQFFNDAPETYRNKLTIRNVTPNSRTESYHSSVYYGIESVEFTGNLLARASGGSPGQILTFHFTQECAVWDNVDADAINLVGTQDIVVVPAGTYLTVKYDPVAGKFVEVSRRS
jgi:hypothetical protein